MTPYDLIIAILDSEGGNEQSTIELINELTSDLLDENKDCSWGKALANEIEEFALQHGRCPVCGGRLVYKSVHEETTEYFGLPVSEEVTETSCHDCDYIYE